MISPYGYGSIPIDTIFSGMNIHLPAILMFIRGTRFWHTAISWNSYLPQLISKPWWPHSVNRLRCFWVSWTLLALRVSNTTAWSGSPWLSVSHLSCCLYEEADWSVFLWRWNFVVVTSLKHATLRQLFINLSNEILQSHFNQHFFRMELQVYRWRRIWGWLKQYKTIGFPK